MRNPPGTCPGERGSATSRHLRRAFFASLLLLSLTLTPFLFGTFTFCRLVGKSLDLKAFSLKPFTFCSLGPQTLQFGPVRFGLHVRVEHRLDLVERNTVGNARLILELAKL